MLTKPEYALARSILGTDLITPEEVTRVRINVVYSPEETQTLVESVPPKTVLEWCKKNDYAVIPAPSRQSWLLIKKTPLTNSTSKTWEEQNELLGEFEAIPNSDEVIWFMMIYEEVRGTRLFENVWVRTSSPDEEGGGHIFANRIEITPCANSCWDGSTHGLLGLAACRKL